MKNEISRSAMRYRLFGSIGSPYALKLRSLMRYKRLPFDWMPATLDWIPENLPHPPLCAASNALLRDLSPKVVPAVYFPEDASVRNESTTIAYLLDYEHKDRPVVPLDLGAAFLSDLIEDMADEWFVKVAFLYRWGTQENATFKSRVVTGEFLGGNYHQSVLQEAAAHFSSRQQSRMPLVGATPRNAPLILESFNRLLKAMDGISSSSTFLFGNSPTLADFGLYGQLQSLATDPTPWKAMRDRGLGIFPYLQLLEDSSGIDPEQIDLSNVGAATTGLLQLAADIYLPYLKSNQQALEEGRPEFCFEVLGLSYTQAPFKYHAKCYRLLQEKYNALNASARLRINEIVDLNDCFSSN